MFTHTPTSRSLQDDRRAPATPAAPVAVSRRTVRVVAVCAVLVPLMVATGFAMLAIVPLGILVHRVRTRAWLARLRPWTTVLAVAYAVPLVLWAALPDRAPSLTKDMHPAVAVAVVVVGLVHLAAYLREWRRGFAA
jgi:hypothetical protein